MKEISSDQVKLVFSVFNPPHWEGRIRLGGRGGCSNFLARTGTANGCRGNCNFRPYYSQNTSHAERIAHLLRARFLLEFRTYDRSPSSKTHKRKMMRNSCAKPNSKLHNTCITREWWTSPGEPSIMHPSDLTLHHHILWAGGFYFRPTRRPPLLSSGFFRLQHIPKHSGMWLAVIHSLRNYPNVSKVRGPIMNRIIIFKAGVKKSLAAVR